MVSDRGRHQGGATALGGDFFGEAVAISADGRTIAVGGWSHDGVAENSGIVKVLRLQDGNWVQLGNNLEGTHFGELFGDDVALSSDGDTVAIGGNGFDGNQGDSQGVVRVYQYNNLSWTQIGSDIEGEAAGDRFGDSVSLSADGTKLAVGAYGNGNGPYSGHVRVYSFERGAWVQMGGDIDGEAADDRSGWSISLSADGTVLAVGAPRNNENDSGSDFFGSGSGHVRIYEYEQDATTWVQLGDDLNGQAAFDLFGWAVALSSDGMTLAVGATGANSDTGAVSVFHYDENTPSGWTLLGSSIYGDEVGDRFGYSVSLSETGNILAIGSRNSDKNGMDDSGHAAIYKFADGTWTPLGTILVGRAAGAQFGFDVALSADGSVVIAGGPYDSEGYAAVFQVDAECAPQVTESITTSGIGGTFTGTVIGIVVACVIAVLT